MDWEKASGKLQKNGTPISVLGYCKIAFDMGKVDKIETLENFICFLVERAEGERITEEFLQQMYADFLKAVQ